MCCRWFILTTRLLIETMAKRIIMSVGLTTEEKTEYWTGQTSIDRLANVAELQNVMALLLTAYNHVRTMTKQIRRIYFLLSAGIYLSTIGLFFPI